MQLSIPAIAAAVALAMPTVAYAVPTGAHALPIAVSESGADATAAAEAEAAPLKEAEREYDAGSAAYELGRYEEAVGHFERSFELSRRKELLFNLGQAYARWYEVSGDEEHLRRARRLFDNYTSSLDERAEHDKNARTDAQRRIDAIDTELRRLEKARKEAEKTEDAPPAKDKPVYKKGWFWGTIVGVVVVGAAATTAGVLLSRRNRKGFDPELGTIGELRPTPGAGVRLRF